jgi:hypothetical protein
MGDRGTKSKFISNFVKAQRVDGSLWNRPFHVRYTLKGFERNYQIKILSTQLKFNKKNFSSEATLISKSKLDPFFVSGLIDAEGTFSISIQKNNKMKLG